MSTSKSTPIRRSIEVEYWVVDREGYLVDSSPLAVASDGAECEFVEPLLEIKTSPCETTAELRRELFNRIHDTLQQANEMGRGLVPLATPISHEEIREFPSERTRIQNLVIGEDFEYVRHCAGTHIHVEQLPGREVDQFNTLIALDPALALVNSSRWFHGRFLALGARSKLYRRMAYDELAHQGRLWRYIGTTHEWDLRLERRYEEFVAAALDAGVNRRAVESNFGPESAIWTPVQLRDTFTTVEWRSPDTALPSQVTQLADSIAHIMERLRDSEVHIEGDSGRITDDVIVLPEFDTVLQHVDAAIRDGVSSKLLRTYLERMTFDVAAYDPLSEQEDSRDRISPAAARKLRLDRAESLEQDVKQTVGS
ncbi:glutamate-cysteine ligase family protein [Haladaptatus sp. CMAA 1911]|uniref:glutamate-cysteine ligase family protein n=1 Tax=unclassified Haladaptatus TaxID=2622732 RepID=UPI0037553CBB